MAKSNNDFFAKKKDWSITKDGILGEYLTPYFQKTLCLRKPICYIDCFAGKGRFDDGQKGSPLIALESIENCLVSSNNKTTNVQCFFIELNHHLDLKNNLPKTLHSRLKTEVIGGRFEDAIDAIVSKHLRDTVFMYVDPYGIKALDVAKFCSFRNSDSKSVEMLINFNTWGFFREACRVLGAEFHLDKETASYLIEYEPSNEMNREELSVIAGGDFWIDVVLDYKNHKIDHGVAEQRLSKGIADAFNLGYKYVLNVPVKSNPNNKTPKYRLFHLTNHEDGCLLMADTMYKWINYSRVRQGHGQLSFFDFNTEGDIENPEKTKDMILRKLGPGQVHLREFLCSFFIEYGIETCTSKLKQYLKELESAGQIEIIRSPKTTKMGKISGFMDEDKNHKVLLRKL